jgi:hypothetical protein
MLVACGGGGDGGSTPPPPPPVDTTAPDTTLSGALAALTVMTTVTLATSRSWRSTWSPGTASSWRAELEAARIEERADLSRHVDGQQHAHVADRQGQVGGVAR